MKKKDITYTILQRQVKDKDTAVRAYVDKTLAMCQKMFTWRGLPDTIPPVELERILQTSGDVFVSEVDGNLYALQGGKGGVVDAYNRPTIYSVANAALNITKNYTIGVDGILINNDTNGNSLLPIIGKYAVLMTDAQISLNTASVLSRITMLISASDDKTKASADLFLQKILDGDFSVIGDNAFFKGVTMQSAATNNASYITQLIELVQYYRATMCNDLGLNANYNMKRERLNLGEINTNVDVLLPYVDNMLDERQRGATAINDKYGTEISVELNSSWQLERENYISLLEDARNTHNHPTEDELTDPTEQVEPTEPTEPTEQVEPTEQDEKEKENDDI